MITLENISYTYKNDTKALQDINLEISKGEILMIVGSNGSGKSTLGNIIANIIKGKGKILLDNKSLKKFKPEEIRKTVGIVFQNPNNQIIFPKVKDDIIFALNNLKIPDKEERIINALKQTGMSDFIYKNPYELSMGEKQRIACACVLAIDPEYIILDEVTSMIDYKGKKDIYNLILDLKKKNKSIVFITNDLTEVIYADKLVLLDKGKIKKIIKSDVNPI